MRWVRLSAAASGLLIASLFAGAAPAQDRSAQPSPTLLEANSGPTIYPVKSVLTSSTAPPQEPQPVPETVVKGDPVMEYPQGEFRHTGNFGDDVWDCCCCCCESGLFGGVEATFLAPLNEPTQTVVLQDQVTNESHVCESDAGLGLGVRTWLGLQRCGWGFRGTFWHFEGDHTEVEPSVPVKTPTCVSAFNLDLDVLDIEVTQKMCFHCWQVYTSFGGRYAHLERSSTVVGFGTLGNNVDLVGLAIGANELEGCGFTFAIGAEKPLGCCFCGWNLFWNFRGSCLRADTKAYALTDANAVTIQPIGQASAHSRDEAFAGKEAQDVFIAEFQAGLQYERCLCCVPATLFFRAVLEYQHWQTGDVTAQTGSFAFLAGGPPAFGGRVDASANGHDGDLTLFGVSVSAGLTY